MDLMNKAISLANENRSKGIFVWSDLYTINKNCFVYSFCNVLRIQFYVHKSACGLILIFCTKCVKLYLEEVNFYMIMIPNLGVYLLPNNFPHKNDMFWHTQKENYSGNLTRYFCAKYFSTKFFKKNENVEMLGRIVIELSHLYSSQTGIGWCLDQ